MSDTNYEADEQDQSEVFDEDNYDAADGPPTNEFKTFEELPDVLDVTSAVGDAEDDEDIGAESVDLTDELGAEGVEPEADPLFGVDTPRLNTLDTESNDLRSEGEVELVYSGLMEDSKGAQASAAHWESRRLSDDDIDELGYGADDQEKTQ